MTADPNRRAMLTGAAALPLIAAAGCKGVGALAAPPRPAPDVGLLKAAIARERLLIARYEAVTRRLRQKLAVPLEPLLADHRAHLAQLEGRLIVPARVATRSPSPSPSESLSIGGPGGPFTPGKPSAAVAHLRSAELRASAALLSQLADATASLAQLLASISASEATHAAILGAAGKTA